MLFLLHPTNFVFIFTQRKIFCNFPVTSKSFHYWFLIKFLDDERTYEFNLLTFTEMSGTLYGPIYSLFFCQVVFFFNVDHFFFKSLLNLLQKLLLLYVLLFFFFGHWACGILAPWPGIDPHFCIGRQSPNHWTSREFPAVNFDDYFTCKCLIATPAFSLLICMCGRQNNSSQNVHIPPWEPVNMLPYMAKEALQVPLKLWHWDGKSVLDYPSVFSLTTWFLKGWEIPLALGNRHMTTKEWSE